MTRTQSRNSKTRELNSREEIEYTFEEPDSTHIPQEVKDRFDNENMSLGWLRVSMKNSDDYTNIGKKISQGWEFVTPEEVPELGSTSFVKKEGRYSGTVCRGDIILGKIPTKKLEAKKRYYQNEGNEMMQAVNAQLMNNSSSRMPISNNSKSTIIKGRNPKFQD